MVLCVRPIISPVLIICVVLFLSPGLSGRNTTTTTTTDCDDTIWEHYKLQFGKEYSSLGEDHFRREIVCANYLAIKAHNERDTSGDFRMALNVMSDRSDQDMARLLGKSPKSKPARRDLHLGRQQEDELVPLAEHELRKFVPLIDKVPDFVDYSKNPGVVGGARSQGDCGACWAFATAGLLESRQRKLKNIDNIIPLSVQQLLDCDKKNDACEGGYPHDALKFIRANGGLQTDESYPYIARFNNRTQGCQANEKFIYPSTKHLGRIVVSESRNELLLKRLLASYGPVVVTINVGWNFEQATDGIVYDSKCKSGMSYLDHSILLVGYGTSEQGNDYWIVKNSWGRRWGVNGFAKLARNRNNNCGVATYPVIIL